MGNEKYVYNDWATTPLKYFYFVCVMLAIEAIVYLVRIVFLGEALDWYSYVYYVVTFTFSFAALVGMIKKAWYGPCLYIAVKLLTMVWSGYPFLKQMANNAYGRIIVLYVISVIPVIIVFSLELIYFRKRRLLFTPLPNDYEPQDSGSIGFGADRAYSQASGEDVNKPVRFCRKCGTGLQPGSRFCTYCGAEVIRSDNERTRI